jgi:hypothetical protein
LDQSEYCIIVFAHIFTLLSALSSRLLAIKVLFVLPSTLYHLNMYDFSLKLHIISYVDHPAHQVLESAAIFGFSVYHDKAQ